MEKRILALETTGNTCSVSISENNETLLNYTVAKNNLHDKLLAEQVRRALNDTELKIEDISAVAVSAGPGSFTGLRIGGGVAKGLTYDNSPKFIAVPTLTAIAFSNLELAKASGKDEIIAIINAYKDLIFFQKFSLDGEEKTEIISTTSGEFKKEHDYKNSLLCGSGLHLFEETVHLPYTDKVDAEIIAKYANKLFDEGKFTDSMTYEPLYVQEFVPKVSKKKLNI